MSPTLEALLLVLLPAAFLGAAAFVTWLAVQVSRYVKDQRLSAAILVLTTSAAGIVASFAQHVVPVLKDPKQPGRWDAASQTQVKEIGIRALKEAFPQTVALVRESMTSDAQLDKLLGNLLEQAVLASKAPKPSAEKVEIATPAVEVKIEVSPRDANGSEVEG